MKISVKDVKYDYGNFIVKGPLSYSLPALGIPVSDLSLEVLTEMQKSYNTFSNNWTTSSVKNLCDSVIADSNAEAGMVYYGKFTGEGLPSSLGLAEMTVEIIADDNSNGKSLVLTVFSADTAPYKWEAQYVKINGNYPSSVTWRAYQQQITSSNKLSASLVSGLPTVPTKVSQLTNDVPYLTEDDLKVEGVDDNGHEYVEIGGIKWATMNVGASSETDAGLYFLWGDTQGYTASQVGNDSGKKEFNWTDYKWSDNGSNYVFTKYNNTDGKTVLDLEDDAVAANWGGSWRMPTTEEIQALREAVNAVWTTNYNGSGIDGLLCTDKTDSSKKLFFPAVSFANNGMVEYVGGEGYVWSSSLDSEYVSRAWDLSFYSGNTAWDETFSREFGLSVRGVLDTGMADKYVTKQELNAETQRAQTVEATKANTADLATVATTGSYNDLTNKPTIPNVAVVNLETEDIDTSTNPITITNQDKISLVCDLIDAGTFVICNLQGGPVPMFGFWFLVPISNGTSLNNVTLFVTNLTVDSSKNPPSGHLYVMTYADVTSRYVTSNTEP